MQEQNEEFRLPKTTQIQFFVIQKTFGFVKLCFHHFVKFLLLHIVKTALKTDSCSSCFLQSDPSIPLYPLSELKTSNLKKEKMLSEI